MPSRRSRRSSGPDLASIFKSRNEGVLPDLNKTQKVTITLPHGLVEAIDRYLDTDWSDGHDPSKFGALNAACYIGEQVAAIRAAGRGK